jgi:fumarylpyruvate hydrolase
MSVLFTPPPPVLAKTSGGLDFPVRRVFCVGRNYAAHAREMGRDPDREPPFFFTKWSETVVPDGAVIPYPPATANFQFEAELVAAIGRGGRSIPAGEALDHVWGYAAGLDMTRRDLQLEAREMGRPWDTGKNVEASSPLGLLHPVSEVGHPASGAITLTVNGEVRQRADLADLIWPVADVIAFLSELYRLEPGDLIYTGTPAGVGPVTSGDRMVVDIAGLAPLSITVGSMAP